jgi:Mycobacterium membrane protein
MTDPQWPQGPDPRRSGWQPPPTEPIGEQSTGYPDPAYAGQFSYPSYTPPGPGSTQQLPPYWTQTQYPAPDQESAPPPEPPRSPRWLWALAGAAVLLVIGLVVALVIANGTSQQESAVTPLPPMPLPSSSAPTTTRIPPRTTTTVPTVPAPPGATTTTESGAEQTVVYSVTGQGRAISITYVDSGGILQMEFNVVLPWTKQVTLSPPASTAASVTVLNVGNDVTCTVTVDGSAVRERTGSGLTICAAAG